MDVLEDVEIEGKVYNPSKLSVECRRLSDKMNLYDIRAQVI